MNAQPLTVIVLNDYCHINGGASRIAIDEAVSLAEKNVRVIFFGATSPICAELQQANIEVIPLGQKELIDAGKNPLIMLQGLWNFTAYKRMNALLKTLDKKNTIIHLHGYTKALTTSPVRAAAANDFKVVCTLHDFFVACPNGAFFDYQKLQICPKRGLSGACISTNCDKRSYVHKIYRVARSYIQKHMGKLPDGVMDYITLSNQSAALLRPYLPAFARYHPLENLIEMEKKSPVDVASKKNIVVVGRLDVEKGIDVVLRAAQIAGVSITFVGDGPLRGQAEALGCTVTGWVKPAQVLDALNEARCLVFPSIWYEAYGLVVSEAAARGVPAIVSNISAASERVEEGVHGWHVKPSDAEDLARALLLTSDNTQVKKAGQAAYERFWSAPPTRKNHVEGLLAIYKTILKRD